MGETMFRTLPSGKIVMSDKPQSPLFDDPADKEARDLRAACFGATGELIPFVLDAIRVGFPDRNRGITPGMKFMEHNATTLCSATRGDDGTIAVTRDLKLLQLSNGPLENAEVEVSVDTEQRNVTFSLSAVGTGDTDHLSMADDRVYGFVLDGERLRGRLVQLGTRGEGGIKTFTIPAKWSVADLHVYVFTRRRRDRVASDTAHVYPTE